MDFTEVDGLLQSWVDAERMPGVSYAVLRGSSVVATQCVGWADREARVPLRPDHLFRIFSNTKLVTSIAALQLLEQGRFGADDPVGEYIPELAHLRVLRPNASSLDDTEPPREPVRIRHLLTHTAGFTYAFLDPLAPIAKASNAAGVLNPATDLADMMRALATVPLLFQPGTAWNYSVATDIVGRLVEILGGERLDTYFRRHIFEPLAMHDTFFFVPEDRAARLATLYIGSMREPMRPGLRRAEHLPFEGAYLEPVARLSGGGGLVSSLGDFSALVGAILDGGAPLLEPATLPLLMRNQLPPGMWIGGTGMTPVEGRGHSFGASVTVHRSAADPSSVEGDLQWGGLAGTKWCVSPRDDLAIVMMTQRYMGSDLPLWPEFKQKVRQALA